MTEQEWIKACARVMIDNAMPLWDKDDRYVFDDNLKRTYSVFPPLLELLLSFETGFYLSTKQNANLLKMKLDGTLSQKVFNDVYKELWAYGKHVCCCLMGEQNGNPQVDDIDIHDHEWAELYWSLLKHDVKMKEK